MRSAGRPGRRDPGLDAARACAAAATSHLLGLQSPEGWWKGELETNVSMDAEDLLLRELLGIADPARIEAAARWIRRGQRSDGSWSTFYGGPADLSVTVEAYLALRLAGDDPESPGMVRAAEGVRHAGGIERARVFTRFWLALFGLWPWERLPTLPPEIVLLPARVPLNVYDFACWARQTVVALTVVAAHRPCHELPFGLDELRSGLPDPVRASVRSTEGRFAVLDSVLAAHERLRHKPLRSLALRRAERWILDRQEADGCWGGIQPPWVYSILALHLLGYTLDHPVMAKAVAGLEGFSIREGDEVRLEACQSPVWDTALAVVALSDAGLPPDHPALRGAGRWLVGEEVRVKGDWAIRRPHLPPGGWAFEFHNDRYPDVDDTAEVVLALRRTPPGLGATAAVERALRWVLGMRSRDGGWAAFDADNTSRLVASLPFCDFGEVTDPPSADVTAHVVEMLAALQEGPAPQGATTPEVPALMAGGVDWLWRSQEVDG
ncbi:MAG: squalene--hopene cyclase, partial [Acidimicrobiales bacterium]